MKQIDFETQKKIDASYKRLWDNIQNGKRTEAPEVDRVKFFGVGVK